MICSTSRGRTTCRSTTCRRHGSSQAPPPPPRAAAQDQVRVDAADDLPILTCDEQLLHQALVNLLTNALQASGRKEPVLVRAFSRGRPAAAICFSVYDDGAGISKEVAERLFTPFFTTRASGTGLGLAVVKRVVEAHGGEIHWHPGGADDRPEGITFTFTIPLAAAPS